MAITYMKGTPQGLSVEILAIDAVERRVNIVYRKLCQFVFRCRGSLNIGG